MTYYTFHANVKSSKNNLFFFTIKCCCHTNIASDKNRIVFKIITWQDYDL